MEPNLPDETTFQKFVYWYLLVKGYERTAEVFRNDAQLAVQLPSELPPFVSDFCQNQNQNQQPTQVNIGPVVINTTTAPIVWDGTPTPIQRHSSYRSGGILLSCDISPRENIVVSGGYGMKPFICYPEIVSSITTEDTHRGAITAVRFHADINLFATASVDTTIKLWDASTPEKVLRYLDVEFGHSRTVRSLDFHPFDNGTLYSSSFDEIKVWDLHQQVMANVFNEGGKIVRVQPVPGSLLAVANGNGIRLLDYHNLRVAMKLEGHVEAINSMCWDVTGTMIASVSEDEVRVWSVREGQCIHRFPSYSWGNFQSVIFHPRYQKDLVIGGYQCLLLLNLENMMPYNTRATELSITGLAATSQFIASASDDSVVKIWM